MMKMTAGTLAILLISAIAPQAATVGFLDDQELKNTTWIPPVPALDGAVEAADVGVYFATRSLVAAPRGTEGHLDDVYVPDEVAPRFGDALGIVLTPANSKIILDTIHLAQLDLEKFVAPIKVKVKDGGRVRPYVQFPKLASCQHDISDSQYHMNESGSYPSTHAALGTLWALVLSQLAPDRNEALFAKGYQFGESRLVCGFHYPSDLASGRHAAMVLFAKLEQNQNFVDHLKASRAQLELIRGKTKPRTPF